MANGGGKYGKDIFNPISHEETRELIAQAQQGDTEARNRVIETNMRYAAKKANQVFRLWGDVPFHLREDVAQAAVLGLVKAIEHFDLTKTNTFLTYAEFWIRHFVQEHLRLYGTPVVFPGQIAQKIRERKKAVEKSNPLPLDHIEPRAKNIMAGTARFPEEQVWAERTVATLLNKLNDKDKDIMSHLYGLNGKELMFKRDVLRKFRIQFGEVQLIMDYMREQGA